MNNKVTDEVILATSLLQRILGLMFRKDFEGIMVLVMPYQSRLNGIHTCFMRFPIDVYFLDSDGRLVDRKLNVPPWRLGVYPRKPAKFIVEVKAGRKLNLDLLVNFLKRKKLIR